MPKTRRYKISAVRYNNTLYQKQIDKILICGGMRYSEARNMFERLLREANFKHVENHMSGLPEKGPRKGFCSHHSMTINLHGNLGPGGYVIEVDEEA